MAQAERPFAAESVPLGNGFLFPQFEFKNVACAKRSSRAGQIIAASSDARLSAFCPPSLPCHKNGQRIAAQ